jgi:hypothetical protein
VGIDVYNLSRGAAIFSARLAEVCAEADAQQVPVEPPFELTVVKMPPNPTPTSIKLEALLRTLSADKLERIKNRELVELTGLSGTVITRALTRLVALGTLTTERRNSKARRLYLAC